MALDGYGSCLAWYKRSATEVELLLILGNFLGLMSNIKCYDILPYLEQWLSLFVRTLYREEIY